MDCDGGGEGATVAHRVCPGVPDSLLTAHLPGSAQLTKGGKCAIAPDWQPGKRQRAAKACQWTFAQRRRLSGCRPFREPATSGGGLGERHWPAGGLFSPGFISHLLSQPHLSELQTPPPLSHPEPGFHLSHSRRCLQDFTEMLIRGPSEGQPRGAEGTEG